VSVKSSLTHPSLIIKRYQGGYKTRSYVHLEGLSPDCGLGIFNGDINTLACALLERMYFCKIEGKFVSPPEVKRNATMRLHRFRNRVLKYSGSPSVLTLQEVVDSYTGRKRTIYQNALDSLCLRPLKRIDGYCKAFVKVEKGKPLKAPRCIQPRDPRYNVTMGRYIKPAEKRIYRGIAKVYGDGPTVMKGFNCEQVGRIVAAKWSSFKDPVAIGVDAVKFDMHVHAEMLKYEHSYYTTLFPNATELPELLSWQIDNRGKAYCQDGKLSYSVKGRRFSGDMNTALGNCIIMCALLWTYAEEKGVHTKLINNGDDAVIFMEAKDLNHFMVGFKPWFLEFGFRMTVEEPVYTLEHIEFCQMHPVVGINGYTMVRNIRTALAKDTMTVLPMHNEKSIRTWLKAIGECGLSLTSGIPMMQAFYRMYDLQSHTTSKVNTSTTMQTGMSMLAKGMEWCDVEPSPESRLSFWEAFRFTPDEQRAYEERFTNHLINYNEIVPADNTSITHLSL
jgi:hypothetical protein